MSIDIKSEDVVKLGQVPDLPCIPQRRGSGRLHPSTVWRWALRGLKGTKLETIRVGGTICTSVEAIQRFFDRLGDTGVPNNKVAQVQRDPFETERQLDRLGVTLQPNGMREPANGAEGHKGAPFKTKKVGYRAQPRGSK